MIVKRLKRARIRWRRHGETWERLHALASAERRSITSWLEAYVLAAAESRLGGKAAPWAEPRKPKDLPDFSWQLLPEEREIVLKAAELDEMTISRWVDGVVTAIVWGGQESGR